MGIQGTHFFISSVAVLLDFVRDKLVYKNAPWIFTHWVWAKMFLRLLQYWQHSLNVTCKHAAENNTDVNEWKSCNSNSVILLSLNSDACGSLKNTKEVPFFQIYIIYKSLSGIWAHQFLYTLWNYHRKCYLSKKLWTAVSRLIKTYYYKSVISSIGNVFQWNGCVLTWHSWEG